MMISAAFPNVALRSAESRGPAAAPDAPPEVPGA